MGTWSVPNSAKGAFNKKIRQFERDVENYDNTCLFARAEDGNPCKRRAVKCHSIPAASVLSKLQDPNGSVLEIGWGIVPWRDMLTRNTSVDLESPELFRPRATGISKASTAPFACDMHDKLFSVIDQSEPDLSDPQVPMLMAYRIALFTMDRWRKYAVFLHKQAEQLTKAHNNAYADSELKKLVSRRDNLNPKMIQEVERLGSLWRDAPTSQTDMHAMALHFQSNLRFAAAVMIDAGTPYVTINPGQDGLHTAVITYRRKDKRRVAKFVNQLRTLSEKSHKTSGNGVGVVERLVADGFGSIVASPSSYASLNDDDRDVIQGTILRLSRPEMLQGIFGLPSMSRRRRILMRIFQRG